MAVPPARAWLVYWEEGWRGCACHFRFWIPAWGGWWVVAGREWCGWVERKEKTKEKGNEEKYVTDTRKRGAQYFASAFAHKHAVL